MSVLGQLVGEVARAALPEVPLDKGVTKANTGVLLLDTLPLITMLPCCQVNGARGVRGRFGGPPQLSENAEVRPASPPPPPAAACPPCRRCTSTGGAGATPTSRSSSPDSCWP